MLRTLIYLKFGILSFLAFIGAIFSSTLRLYLLGIIVVCLLILLITYLTPEPPSWRMGRAR